MDLKVIMVPFGGDNSEVGALRTALELAKTHNAHVEAWHITPSPYSASTVFYPGQGLAPIYSEELLQELKRTYEVSRLDALKKFSEIVMEMGVEHIDDDALPNKASASFQHATGDAREIISARSRLCDLTVISRATNEENKFYKGIIYSALFDSARPVLLIPAGKSLDLSNTKIIVAWNNSIEAARAVAFSFPFLEHSKTWIWTSDKDNQRTSSGDGDLLHYLKMHGAEAEELLPNATTPESLLMSAKTLGASMIVMGAYSHNRFRETILGGMTNFMLKNANIPILMAH
jgi:nucleotide-binding universal stress UspA family protein